MPFRQNMRRYKIHGPRKQNLKIIESEIMERSCYFFGLIAFLWSWEKYQKFENEILDISYIRLK